MFQNSSFLIILKHALTKCGYPDIPILISTYRIDLTGYADTVFGADICKSDKPCISVKDKKSLVGSDPDRVLILEEDEKRCPLPLVRKMITLERPAVISVQTVVRTDPDKALLVLHDRSDLIRGKSLLDRHMTKECQG